MKNLDTLDNKEGQLYLTAFQTAYDIYPIYCLKTEKMALSPLYQCLIL